MIGIDVQLAANPEHNFGSRRRKTIAGFLSVLLHGECNWTSGWCLLYSILKINLFIFLLASLANKSTCGCLTSKINLLNICQDSSHSAGGFLVLKSATCALELSIPGMYYAHNTINLLWAIVKTYAMNRRLSDLEEPDLLIEPTATF